MRNLIDIPIEPTAGEPSPVSPVEEKEKRKIVKGAKEGINAVRLSTNDSDIIEFMADKGAFSTYVKKLIRREIELQAEGVSIFDDVAPMPPTMPVAVDFSSVDTEKLNRMDDTLKGVNRNINGLDNKLDMILELLKEQVPNPIPQAQPEPEPVQNEPEVFVNPNAHQFSPAFAGGLSALIK